MNELQQIKQDLNAHVVHCNTESEGLKRRVSTLEKELEKRHKEERRENFILYGGDCEPTVHGVQNFLSNVLEVDDKVATVRLLGKGGAMMLVRMQSMEGKTAVMQNKGKRLAGTKISIKNDLTPREQEIQRKLHDLAQPFFAENQRVRIGYRKLT